MGPQLGTAARINHKLEQTMYLQPTHIRRIMVGHKSGVIGSLREAKLSHV